MFGGQGMALPRVGARLRLDLHHRRARQSHAPTLNTPYVGTQSRPYLPSLCTLYSVLRTLIPTFAFTAPAPSRAPLARLLPIQAVRKVIEVLAAVLRDDDHVFNPYATKVLTIQAGLNGQGFAR